jgi:hypothetical protein
MKNEGCLTQKPGALETIAVCARRKVVRPKNTVVCTYSKALCPEAAVVFQDAAVVFFEAKVVVLTPTIVLPTKEVLPRSKKVVLPQLTVSSTHPLGGSFDSPQRYTPQLGLEENGWLPKEVEQLPDGIERVPAGVASPLDFVLPI